MTVEPSGRSGVEPFDAVDVIRGKRDGRQLADDELRWMVDAFTRGVVAPEQMSAFLMAVVFRGMAPAELTAWADAMLRSGERLDLSGVGRPTVDKHSTGGVGDKTSLPLAPLVAACGLAMPQLSGRGLGHTGGTLDKMEAIPGWRASLSLDEVRAVLRDVGAVICAAGPGLAPADRELYALRDVTGTVESVPLIASSIMSKKIAEGTSALVLDVKVGSGAFLPSVESARELATTMVGLGEAYGVRTAALLTAMETPLGLACGNGLEVAESVEVLRGGGPADVVEVTVALAREMLALVGVDGPDPAEVLASGAALGVWEAMVRAQGGDPAAELPRARRVEQVRATSDGVLQRLDARAVGIAAWRLGAGRSRRDEPVSAAAGVLLRAKPGDDVRAGDVLLELHTDEPARLDRALAALEGGWALGPDAVTPSPLVLERIGAAPTDPGETRA